MFAKSATNVFIRNLGICKKVQAFRTISVSAVNRDIVKIQSTDDFKDKVINSKVPVVVDFFAT